MWVNACISNLYTSKRYLGCNTEHPADIWKRDIQSPNSERDSIMPCAVKSSFENRSTDISLEINHIDSRPVSLLTKTGFHASNRR
jgi:hypothetical protein